MFSPFQTSTHRPHAKPLARKLSPPLLIGLAAAAGIAGCATAGPYNPHHLTPAQLGQFQDVCRSVMGTSAPSGAMENCVDSLSSSAVALRQARVEAHALRDARGDCRAKGLSPGQSGIAECELDAAASTYPTPASRLAAMPIDGRPPAYPVRSMYRSSFDEVRRREEVACARVGYDPIDHRNFAGCVARLDDALFRPLEGLAKARVTIAASDRPSR